MNHRNASAPAWLGLALLLTGCHHTGKAPSASAPQAPPAVGPVMVSVPPPTHHDQPEIVVSTSPVAPPSTEPVRRPARQSRRNSAAAATQAAPPANAASSAAAASTPPISLGELSAGGEVASGLRQQTADLLKSQQQRLDNMDRTTLATHPTETAQARNFLQRANTSWNAADYEGAHTLVVKAKVLLDDLKQ